MEELAISAGTSRCETSWRTLRLTWAEFTARLERPVRTAETAAQYAAMPPGERVRAKDVGGFVGGVLSGGARRAGSVESRCLLALDADHAMYAEEEREGAGEARFALWENWRARYGFAAALHSTHSHTRAHPRFRLLIPLSRPVAPDEYEAVARRVAFDLGIDAFDDTTYQPGRLMFWPSVCRDGEYVLRLCEGPWLDPDAVLARYADWRDTARWPVSSRQSRALTARAGRLGDPGLKPGPVGAFCRAYDVPAAIGRFLSHVYAPAREPGRYTYRAGSAYGGAVVYDGGRFLYSYHDTDPAGGRLLNAFDLVRVHLFGERDAGTPPGTPMRTLPSYAAMQALCRAASGEGAPRSAGENAGERAARRTGTEPGGERKEQTAQRGNAGESAGEPAFADGAAAPPEAGAKEGAARVSVREAAVALSRSPDDYTEQGTAVAFADAYADALCWQDDLRWVAWDGTRWAPDAQAEATLCMMRFTDEMMARAKAGLDGAPMGSAQAREAEAALRWAVSCRSATRIGRTLRLAQALMKRHALSDFDADPWLLNTPGGMVDLRTGRMRPHDPAALCTAITHLAPAPDADAPRYTQFLYRITGGDGELCDYLQRVAGMALVGEVYEEGITICHGPGGNGKSTLFGLWQDVLGDYAGTIRPELLVPRRDSSEPFGLEQVRGKRLVVASETDEGLGLNQSVLKRLASQDQISANPKGRDPFSFRPSHTLIMHTNHLPRIRSVDEGTRRRIAVLPLTNPIGRAEMVTDFRARLLQSEGPQILRWMIEGARMFYEDHMKLRKPEAVQAASREYLSGEDWLRGFLTERCVLGEEEAVPGGLLYEAFHQWSLENGERYPRRSREFASALRSRGFEARHTRAGNVWAGVGLRGEPAERGGTAPRGGAAPRGGTALRDAFREGGLD